MLIDMTTYVLRNPEDYEDGGYVKIECPECGFNGFVDVDDTRDSIRGNCAGCDLGFESRIQ